MMRGWHDFLDSIDSDGGTRFVLLVLILVGMAGTKLGIPYTDKIMELSLGALLLAMKDSGSNKDRREGAPMPLPTLAGAPAAAPSVAPIVAAVDHVAAAIEEKP